MQDLLYSYDFIHLKTLMDYYIQYVCIKRETMIDKFMAFHLTISAQDGNKKKRDPQT